MPKETLGRRARRQFSEEFDKTVGAVARELDLTASAPATWVKHARAERSQGRTGLTKAEREELSALRKENRVLREEREIIGRRRFSRNTWEFLVCFATISPSSADVIH